MHDAKQAIYRLCLERYQTQGKVDIDSIREHLLAAGGTAVIGVELHERLAR